MPVKSAYIVPHPPLIIPQIGQGNENKVKSTIAAYEKVGESIAREKPTLIVVITPHSVMYADYFHISPGSGANGNFGRFGSPAVSYAVEYDAKLVYEIAEICGNNGIYAGIMGEKTADLDHGAMIPLHFINKYYNDYKVIRISVSGLSYDEHYRFGMCIKEALNNKSYDTVIVASGDLSHKLTTDGPYGFAPEGPEFDKKIVEIMKSGRFGEMLELDENFCDAAAECGLRSFIIMAGILDGCGVEPEFLSYEGPFGVGYAVCGFKVLTEEPSRKFLSKCMEEKRSKLNEIKSNEDEFVKLARLSLETYIKTGKRCKRPANLQAELLDKAGVFVSLKKNGRLRGCIGTIAPSTDCVADEIIQNAVSSGTTDFRFEPVTADELDELVYSVDVLCPPEKISDKSELDVTRYGVIVQNSRKRGLLLPNLESVDTVDKQIEIALSKAGISKGESFEMERFEVVRHK